MRDVDAAGTHPGALVADEPPPGVTRYDVLCRPGFLATVLGLLDGWGDDRALCDTARERLARLMTAAVEHATRFEPRALTVSVRWSDVERVRVDLRWFGCTDAASPRGEHHDLAATIATLDTHAHAWGVARTDSAWVQWIDVDTAAQGSGQPTVAGPRSRTGTSTA